MEWPETATTVAPDLVNATPSPRAQKRGHCISAALPHNPFGELLVTILGRPRKSFLVARFIAPPPSFWPGLAR